MKRIVSIILTLAAMALPLRSAAEGLKTFQLRNGLTVFVWEDPTKDNVYGEVAVRTGSVNDPEQYTGLAHYLEHMMFKGTQKIGALDWEAEKPIYEQIIAKYDEMAQTEDQAARESIAKEINELTIKEAEVSVSNEFSSLVEGLGGSGLNAGTSYDYTVYYNSFPPNQIGKWLSLSSERFLGPVFRAFQPELETVYEEFNRGNDNGSSQAQKFLFEKIFDGTPYARQIIGLGEHLKNPRLSKLIEFYNTWYTADNMALILVGNVDTQSILRLVNATFGRIPKGQAPQMAQSSIVPVKGRVQYTTKCSNYPSVVMAYDGVKSGDEDEIVLDITTSVLSNSSETGLLDRMSINGDFMGAGASAFCLSGAGRTIVTAVPYYDEAQRMYESNKNVEKLLDKAVRELAEGKFDEWVVDAVKKNLCRDFDLMMEDSDRKASLIRNAFINRQDINEELLYKEKVMAVTVEDVKACAKKYFGADHIVIYNEIGKPDKSQKIKKPGYKPIDSPAGKSSEYAQFLGNMANKDPEFKFIDWESVAQKPLNSYSKIYYTKNTRNDVYTLTLKYGASEKVFPKLSYGAELMNNAGILGQMDPHQLKEAFAKLGATYSIGSDGDYLYVTLRGYEQNLQESCLLLTRLLLMPALDEKQVGNIKGGAISGRFRRKEEVNMIAGALREYMVYGPEESEYKTELTDKELVFLDMSDLTGQVIGATKYAAEIHYCGQMPLEQVYSILSTSLPLVEGEKPTTSPRVRPMMDYKENTVFFVPSNDAQQSQIYFYIPMGEYDKSKEVVKDAFNCYMSSGLNGIIFQEIREKNSMAYSAYGYVQSQGLPGAQTAFIGYVGTQNDKAIDAIRLYTKIMTDIPQEPDNIEGVKTYLKQTALTEHPDERSLSSVIASLQKKGYTQDPTIEELPQIEELSFEDILRYFEENIKGRPIVIGVVGNPKAVDTQKLSEFGKLVRLQPRNLYNDKDVMF